MKLKVVPLRCLLIKKKLILIISINTAVYIIFIVNSSLTPCILYYICVVSEARGKNIWIARVRVHTHTYTHNILSSPKAAEYPEKN